MILEHALLRVRPGEGPAFEMAMREAAPLIAASPGFLGMEVRPSIETDGLYLLLVRWRSVADHDQGFRGSDRYQRWRALLHRFYEPFPEVGHFAAPLTSVAPLDLLRLELFVADVARSVDFYERVLGFHVAHRSGDYVAMRLGLATISLNARSALPADHPLAPVPGGKESRSIEVVIPVDDVDAVHAGVRAAGWPAGDAPMLRPWGWRDFRIEDPDGNYLRVQSASAG